MLCAVGGIRFACEKRLVSGRRRNSPRIQPDISLSFPPPHHPRVTFLDISIGESLAPSHHSASLNASLPLKIEKSKEVKYSDICTSLQADFSPIAFLLSNTLVIET